jgi:hypothetical protein
MTSIPIEGQLERRRSEMKRVSALLLAGLLLTVLVGVGHAFPPFKMGVGCTNVCPYMGPTESVFMTRWWDGPPHESVDLYVRTGEVSCIGGWTYLGNKPAEGSYVHCYDNPNGDSAWGQFKFELLDGNGNIIDTHTTPCWECGKDVCGQ